MWMFIGIMISLGGAALLWFAAIRPALKRKKADDAEEASSDDVPQCTETCEIFDRAGAAVRYECGHDDAPEFRIALWGEPLLRKRPEQPPKICSECLLKKALKESLRCGSCGYAILPGHPISLCVDDGTGKKEWRTVFDGQLALCLRWACGAGPGFCGHWMGNGIKPAFPDGGNQISQAFNSGKPVFTEIGPLDVGKKDS